MIPSAIPIQLAIGGISPREVLLKFKHYIFFEITYIVSKPILNFLSKFDLKREFVKKRGYIEGLGYFNLHGFVFFYHDKFTSTFHVITTVEISCF